MKARVRILAPGTASEAGVHGKAGDVVEAGAEVAEMALRCGAVEPTTDPLGAYVEPVREGYDAMDRPELVRLARGRRIANLWLLTADEIRAVLKDDDLA